MTGAELDRQPVEGRVICGKVQASCRCTLDEGHDGPHVCDDRCRGSWLGEGATFEVYEWPAL